MQQLIYSKASLMALALTYQTCELSQSSAARTEVYTTQEIQMIPDGKESRRLSRRLMERWLTLLTERWRQSSCRPGFNDMLSPKLKTYQVDNIMDNQFFCMVTITARGKAECSSCYGVARKASQGFSLSKATSNVSQSVELLLMIHRNKLVILDWKVCSCVDSSPVIPAGSVPLSDPNTFI